LYPPLRFASLYVAIRTARNIGLVESQNPSSNHRTTPGNLAVGPSLVEGFVKAFTFTSNLACNTKER
jgi:hypothetical protein